MSNSQKKALSAFRRRQKRKGVVRLEIQVRKEDAALLRGMAAALADPAREGATRALLREQLARHAAPGLKALLTAAPLEGIDLGRVRDKGRDVDL